MLETVECAFSSDFKWPHIWININQAAMQFIIVKLSDPASCTLRKFYWLIDFIVMILKFSSLKLKYVIHGLVNTADLVT